MIIVRAPLRISFVGGGTDFPDFYKHHTGKVISTTIDKYVYVTINSSPLLKGITARYSEFEHVERIDDLKNDRIREVMKYFKIKGPIEISVMSDLPVGFGLGGSSAFTVALIKGFNLYKNKSLTMFQIAKLACHIERATLKEPIGVQDQYASAIGGFREYLFDKQVTTKGLKRNPKFEEYLCLFYTGNTRETKTILTEQKKNIPKKMLELQGLAEYTDIFLGYLIKEDFENLGYVLYNSWTFKRELASTISNPKIDKLYSKAILAGAWGGKVCGAGGGGCLLFMAPPNKHKAIRMVLGLQQIPFKFSQEGVEVING